MTTINNIAIPIKPGIPALSINPVDGKAVVLGVAVSWASAACVNNAATVAVLGSSVGIGVSVGTASSGVGDAVGVTAGGTSVLVGVEVKAAAADVWVIAWATAVFCEFNAATCVSCLLCCPGR